MSVARPVALAAAACLTLASCSPGDDTTGEPATSRTPTSNVSVPPSVTLTEPGSAVAFGDTVSVIFEPDQERGTVLELTVDKATRGSTRHLSGFILDSYTKAATPYYARVSVTNVGDGDVGGAPVPLWGVDAKNTLLPPASFTTSFGRCPSDPLPKRFGAGDSMNTCLVYLSPDGGTLEGVSFRPDQEFNPIQWTGEVVTPRPQPKKSGKPN